MRPSFLRAGLVLALAVGPGRVASACPNCREAIAAQPTDVTRMAEGYNRSILVMMAMPFALLGLGGLGVVRAVRRGALPPL